MRLVGYGVDDLESVVSFFREEQCAALCGWQFEVEVSYALHRVFVCPEHEVTLGFDGRRVGRRNLEKSEVAFVVRHIQAAERVVFAAVVVELYPVFILPVFVHIDGVGGANLVEVDLRFVGVEVGVWHIDGLERAADECVAVGSLVEFEGVLLVREFDFPVREGVARRLVGRDLAVGLGEEVAAEIGCFNRLFVDGEGRVFEI